MNRGWIWGPVVVVVLGLTGLNTALNLRLHRSMEDVMENKLVQEVHVELTLPSGVVVTAVGKRYTGTPIEVFLAELDVLVKKLKGDEDG